MVKYQVPSALLIDIPRHSPIPDPTLCRVVSCTAVPNLHTTRPLKTLRPLRLDAEPTSGGGGGGGEGKSRWDSLISSCSVFH
jgi:hypothetical protein